MIVILALIAPKSYDVNRAISINKPLPEVFQYLKLLKNQDNWSPWAEKDPNMNKTFKGTDGEIGFVSAWVGNKDVGEGEQEITGIIENEVVKSSEESDYNELIVLEATGANGAIYSVRGTLIGKSGMPRIVHINGREVEASPEGVMLVLENQDVPGIVGTLGSILGRNGVNIASMSLSRNHVGGLALNVVNLDTAPSDKAFQEIVSNENIKSARVVTL